LEQREENEPLSKTWLFRIAVIAVAAAAVFVAWPYLKPEGLPDGFASSNGRIEATEIDVAAKIAGRVREILADEGDFIEAGQVLARMDTDVLQAERREAEAALARAQISIETAKSLVTQREAEKAAAQASVAQQEAELVAAQRRLQRTESAAPRGAVALTELDEDRARAEGARAAVSAAEAEVAAADAALNTARSQIVDADAAVQAARATIDRIQADIDDGELRSPRSGRVQYRVAEPGEVLDAGGVVLNMVDLTDVYMTFFLPTEQAGRVAVGAEVRLVLDAAPQYAIPARATFVADVAQFTPKTVETQEERAKLMFRIKAQIDPDLLERYITQVKTGLPGVAYVQLDAEADWPPELQNVPQP
jgi:HlyD family secretion protein